MKLTCLLLLIIGAQLASRALYAASAYPAQNQTASATPPKAVSAQGLRPGGDSGAQTDARAGGEKQKPQRAAKSRTQSKAAAINSARTGRVTGRQALPAMANPGSARSLAPAQSTAVVSHSSPQNEAIYRALPVRPGGAVLPASPSAGTVRHRDPNAAIVGGAANSNIRSTATIDGTRMNLKGSRK